jgi:carbamoyltransferase
MSEVILGLSAFYHDSAAAILVDGRLIAAAHEERFTRKKHDAGFPRKSIEYVLNEAGVTLDQVTHVAFYDKPMLKFERLMETYHACAPRGLISFFSSVPVWIKEKLFMKKLLRDELLAFGSRVPPIFFPEHHLSHGASAFYPSPFESAAILTVDGVGEWATTTISHGRGNKITVLKQLDFPHSLGLLYSAFTYYTGFKVNSGEYKLMGLAPYGIEGSARVEEFRKKIVEQLVDIREDGSFLLNMDYFNFATGLTMTHSRKWEKLFGLPRRKEETDLSQPYMDMALAIQLVTNEIMLKLARTAKDLTGERFLCMAGGVALNSVANGKILKTGWFEDVWIQPSAGDAGGALGAAYAAWHIGLNKERKVAAEYDAMKGAYLGPSFTDRDVEIVIRKYSAVAIRYDNFDELSKLVASKLAESLVVGWVQGRMEYGPRALGSRSILGDARNPETQKKMNLKIKFREGFRPFAPVVLEEDVAKYFDTDKASPYMLFVVPVVDQHRKDLPPNFNQLGLFERLYHPRSDIPAVTHLDYSARIQTVSQDVNPRFWKLLNDFKNQTGCSVLVNTSFNVRGEPIICDPDDAYRCFLRTEMDYLVVGNYIFKKSEQPQHSFKLADCEQFQLD